MFRIMKHVKEKEKETKEEDEKKESQIKVNNYF